MARSMSSQLALPLYMYLHVHVCVHGRTHKIHLVMFNFFCVCVYTGFFNEDGSIRHSGNTHAPTGIPRDTLEKIGHVFSNVPEEVKVHSGKSLTSVCVYKHISIHVYM